jgi:YYY domain-containing protein
MLNAIVWWLLLSLVGLLALPLTLRLLRFLPERGLGLSRHVGLLLTGYSFWLLCSLGLFENTRLNIALVLLVLACVSGYIYWRNRQEMASTLRRLAPILLSAELLFMLAFFGFCFFRAYNPEIAATEKPMEFGFINAILRSQTFPPHDPWLAGYSISYYYMGYVLIAMLTRLAAIPSSITFNLGLATAFAMTVLGAYTIVFNLVSVAIARKSMQLDETPKRSLFVKIRYGLYGAVFVALLGNLEGVFEFIRARGWGSAALWRWLDIRNLQATPISATWYPDDSWWWWRATRLLHDRDSAGVSQEVISEFPFFSFLLGDNHPHVLALPYVLLAISLALNMLLGWLHVRQQPIDKPTANTSGLRGFLYHLWPGSFSDILLWGLMLGALIFFNTWDYPIYFVLFLLSYLVGRLGAGKVALGKWLVYAVQMGGVLLALGIGFYLPFLLSFRSQAGGIGLVTVKTQWQQYALMFGPFLLIAFSWLAVSLWPLLAGRPLRLSFTPWARYAGIAVLGLVVVCLAFGWWVAAISVLGLGMCAVLLLNWQRPEVQNPAEQADASRLFVLLMTLLGFGLTLVVEFIFLRDTFGTRMNTVFKFYYQAWVLLSLAAAFGLYLLGECLRSARAWQRVWRAIWLGVVGLIVAGGLLYTVMATISKTNAFTGTPTLDGTRYLLTENPDDAAAIAWLRTNAPPDAVLLEAPGDSYSDYNRISAFSGVPTLLGWGGHELQWRGNYDIPKIRESDISTIYSSTDLALTRQLLQQYGVTYVILGPLERQKYGLGSISELKFDQLLTRVYQHGALIIYGWPQ